LKIINRQSCVKDDAANDEHGGEYAPAPILQKSVPAVKL
jgi:hypothetical protein